MTAPVETQQTEENAKLDNRRYAIDAHVDFEMLRGTEVVQRGTGRTVNISSGGVYFRGQAPLPVGTNIKMYIAWPARLNGRTGLNLCVSGMVLRSEGEHTAVQIVRYEFRTRKMAA